MPSSTDGPNRQAIVSKPFRGDRKKPTRHFFELGMLIEDMQIRNLAVDTQNTYVLQVSMFARHFGKSPEILGPEEIRAYQVYLTIPIARRKE